MIKKIGIIGLFVFLYSFVFSQNSPFFEYTLKKDDSLLVLCDIFNVSSQELEKLNGKEKIQRFWQGDSIKIPLKDFKITPYTVKKGDTVFDLVKKTGANIEQIYVLNDESTLSRMWVGDNLLLPIPYQANNQSSPSPLQQKQEKKVLPNPSQNFIKYKVQKGDSFFSLSRKFNVSVDILKANYPYATLYAGSILTLNPEQTNQILMSEPLKGLKTPSRFSIPGIHYKIKQNTTVSSPLEGEVIGIRHLKGFGRAVFIKQKGALAILASKGYENILVSYGYQLKRAQHLATVRKGYFVHFFLLKNNNFISPESFFIRG